MAHLLSRSVLSVLLVHLCFSAPGQPEVDREEDSVAAVANPFQSKEESHRLLRGYIDSILNKEGQERSETTSRDQDVFFLFRLHDYDRSGHLDGLELLKLLHDFNAYHAPGVFHSNDKVVSVVDFLLKTQDLNQDGLFSPFELLSPSLPTQHEENDTIEGVQNEEQVQMTVQPQEEEERTEEDSPVASVDEQLVLQEAQNNPVTGQAENMVPVHQGQPEI